MDNLEDVQPCQIEVLVDDGLYSTATHQGTVKLRFTLDQGTIASLTLKQVLFVPGLTKRLFPYHPSPPTTIIQQVFQANSYNWTLAMGTLSLFPSTIQS